ncbi:MAG: heme-binding protein, partial [Proteobacteria bacterium]|nr:heme-binding protein [Pseudomonadota bacterium]
MKNLLLPTLIALSFPAAAAQPDVLPVKQISLELARDIAMGAVEAC